MDIGTVTGPAEQTPRTPLAPGAGIKEPEAGVGGRNAPPIGGTTGSAAYGLEDGAEALVRFLAGRRSAVVLSGAGLSTESGIPDYRGVTGRLRPSVPMTFQDFTADEANRRRYWARSHLGWRAITQARPNTGHLAVTRLMRSGLVSGVITQNVDGLHSAAGAPETIDLHGRLDRVVCLDCGDRSARARLDERLAHANPGFRDITAATNADGDAELPAARTADFRIVACEACRVGTLKPDVVFFGENVPAERVQRCYDLVDPSFALLVLGSSLTVMSGLRFARRAARQGTPVAIVNQGPTRGDALAALRLDLPLGQTLTALADRFGA
ncbi:NAD-dependent protein deacetylase, SIR2 family [Streptomyces sp. DvalAA-14]|uniref:NAD-dependent protein deacetylase n=1 Tax=Streptomyces sp. DvalAA-14 TaxID=1839759 RepID=UPI00081B5A9C|nr:NAD-dependent protein deacetylase [Streptomyces sp. SID4948]SCE14362.1 NAD-dependent protein deacetylase, SIR2 family [Streptomyces sp. DvalAA-14]